MLQTLRTPLYIALAFVVFLLRQAWEKDHQKHAQFAPVTAISSKTSGSIAGKTPANNPDVPKNLTTTEGPSLVDSDVATERTSKIVTVDTDTVAVKIDLHGGSIVGLSLKKFPESVNDKNGKLVQMFQESSEEIYTAQSGLQGHDGPDGKNGVAEYQSASSNYAMVEGQNHLEVVMTHSQNGVVFDKIMRFTRGSYLIDVTYRIHNEGEKAWQGRFYSLLKRSKVESKHMLFTFPTYTGGAISSDSKRFEEISFDDMSKKPLDREVKNGWIAMVQHYFVSAWLPDTNENYRFYTSVSDDALYRLGMVGPELVVKPGEEKSVNVRLYAGPENTSNLAAIAPGLELTVDYGWFWPISQGLFWVMKKLQTLSGNWGVTIILVTLLIKLCFYRLSAASYRSMANMRRIQPKLVALKDRYGDDKQKMSQATIELYRKEKINPLGGCLPILVQIPVFIALYWVLIESVELRHAPFFGWINDLSTKDPYYVLPLIMGATMLLQQKLSPAPPDPMQAKVMMAMPVVFTLLFLNFPAGLMLYWVVNNSLSIAQQWFITRGIEHKAKVGRSKKAANDSN